MRFRKKIKKIKNQILSAPTGRWEHWEVFAANLIEVKTSSSACFWGFGSTQSVVCIPAEDFLRGGEQFEPEHRLKLYISPPNLLVIRLNLLSCFWTYPIIPHAKGNILMIIIILSACQRGIMKSAGTVVSAYWFKEIHCWCCCYTLHHVLILQRR